MVRENKQPKLGDFSSLLLHGERFFEGKSLAGQMETSTNAVKYFERNMKKNKSHPNSLRKKPVRPATSKEDRAKE